MMSENAERFWLMVHAEQGPHLVCVWYRPPGPNEIQSISSFKSELASFSDMFIGCILVGDVNVHDKLWLHFSSHNSSEGKALKEACDEFGMEQKVRKPTREGHLLDLVLTDIHGVTTRTLPAISDHKLVFAEMHFTVPEHRSTERMVWVYQKADWERTRAELMKSYWSFMESANPHAGAL